MVLGCSNPEDRALLALATLGMMIPGAGKVTVSHTSLPRAPRQRSPLLAPDKSNNRKRNGAAFVETFTAGSANIRFAVMVPMHPPIICAHMNATVSVLVSARKRRKDRVTTGLKCAPETGPNIRINPMSAPAVAAAFSRS